MNIQEGLTPSHLKKAKLMFFYTRYPSSNVLKTYFPDVKVISSSCIHQVKEVVFPSFTDLSVCFWDAKKKKNQQCVGGEKQKRRGFK